MKAQVVKGKETAVKVLSETEKLLKRYETEEAGHNKEMQRIRDQIQMLNSKIDISILDVSTDCIDKCRTGVLNEYFLLYKLILLHRKHSAQPYTKGCSPCPAM